MFIWFIFLLAIISSIGLIGLIKRGRVKSNFGTVSFPQKKVDSAVGRHDRVSEIISLSDKTFGKHGLPFNSRRFLNLREIRRINILHLKDGGLLSTKQKRVAQLMNNSLI